MLTSVNPNINQLYSEFHHSIVLLFNLNIVYQFEHFYEAILVPGNCAYTLKLTNEVVWLGQKEFR